MLFIQSIYYQMIWNININNPLDCQCIWLLKRFSNWLLFDIRQMAINACIFRTRNYLKLIQLVDSLKENTARIFFGVCHWKAMIIGMVTDYFHSTRAPAGPQIIAMILKREDLVVISDQTMLQIHNLTQRYWCPTTAMVLLSVGRRLVTIFLIKQYDW